MMRTATILLALFMVGALVGTGSADDYFVRPDGNDGNTGKGNTPLLAFKTIQKAVNTSALPSGDRIYVSAGTFTEQVTIRDKSLSLIGGEAMPGIPAGTTVLQMPLIRAADPTKKRFTGAQTDPTLWVQDTTPATADVVVTISKLTIDGLSSYTAVNGNPFAGIIFYNCGGFVSHCTIQNYQQFPAGGAQGCIGILVDCDPLYKADTNVSVYDCTFQNIQKASFVVFSGAGHVRNSNFCGYGPVGFIAQNGIQFSKGGSGSVHGCSVSGYEYSGASWSSSGILLHDSTGVIQATGNTITGCDVCVYITTTSPISIATHRFAGNAINNFKYTGIYTQAQGTGNYEGNRFFGSRAGSDPVFDDGAPAKPKNIWTGNFYYDVSTPSTRGVPGYALNTDTDARPAPASLGTPTTHAPGGVDPRGIATGDLNEDGNADLAFVDTASDKVRIQYGDGLGGIAGSQIINLLFGSDPVAIAFGNLDGATGLDIAIACENGTVVALLNNGGSPYTRFSIIGYPVTISVTGISPLDRPAAISVGDVDGSNNDDILVALAGTAPAHPGSGRLLVNIGTGTSFVGTNIFGSLITSARGCTLCDMDGDTDLDAVITDAGLTSLKTTNNVRTYSNTGGIFSTGPVLTAGKSPRGVLCSDLDMDGFSEIVVANHGDPTGAEKGTVSVFQNRSNGALAFAAAVNTTADFGTVAVAAGDLFQDSETEPHRDVVAVNSGINKNVTLLLDWRKYSMTGGAFSATGSVTSPGNPAHGVALADMDNNGVVDLVTTNSSGTNAVSIFPGHLSAQVGYYGQGCAGYKGRIPVIGVEGGLAVQPNLAFGITLANASPSSWAVLAGGILRANPLPVDCGILLGTIQIWLPMYTDSAGTARMLIPIPAMPPDVSGITFYWQWGVYDGVGKFFGFALSNGLSTRLGR